MKRLIASLFLVAAMAGTALADVFVFETVDEFELRAERVDFRGVLQGEVNPSDLTARWSGEPVVYAAKACERMALMAMARPGRYLLQVTTDFDGFYHSLYGCRLIRR